ncbi:MAG TPA: glycosyltransferase family 1 protein [Streptosporangiaceae bacterium]|nr:glycosyltransferase family 1 protein [Streptosporangiaceae bacterium]
MRILIWHLHGSWLTSFVQGPHDYLVPVTPERGPFGLGRARTWDWPASVVEVSPSQLRDADVDLVVLQRPEELSLTTAWLGRTPGRDVPAVYLEHDTPPVPGARHPMAGVENLTIVHVTHFNALFWDCGASPVTVIEHGVIDPGATWTGELDHAAVVINDPLTRGRTVGADLLPGFAAQAPLDVFGMRVDGLARAQRLDAGRVREYEDLPQAQLHTELPRRRVYVHPFRWTSLGLALIEAMFLAMPVVVLATTEAPRAVPPEAGAISADLSELHAAVRRFIGDPAAAREAGLAAREAAGQRYGLKRFLRDWDQLLQEVSA